MLAHRIEYVGDNTVYTLHEFYPSLRNMAYNLHIRILAYNLHIRILAYTNL